MSTRTMYKYLTAGWREAARAREPYIDLDHLLIGLIAAGGPAAQALSQHDITLSSARTAAGAVQADAVAQLGVDVHVLPASTPRPVSELNYDDAGDVPSAKRVQRLLDSLGMRVTERDLLRALLAEPSGTIREMIEHTGADPKAVMADVEDAADWTTPTPRRARTVESQAHERTVAVLLTHFIPADAPLVRSVAADPALAPQWLMLPEMEQQADGALAGTWTKRARTSTLRLALTADAQDRVRWSDQWNDGPWGWYDLRLTPAEGGTMLTLTRAVRPLGLVGAALGPVIRLTNGLGLLVRAQNLSFACADAIEQDLR
ncbi:hypothetical protein GCM10025781_08250 [Kocuria gwangalliensis]|uniref:Clp R domain-containing protein n=1 Tax=Kocuria gwangalliensis TaxID=501592 RepID=A0ABP8WPC4_9MICC